MTFEEYWKSRHGEGPTSTYGISEARDAWNAALEEAANRIKHHIGWFDDPALAHAAYMAEKKKLHIVMTI